MKINGKVIYSPAGRAAEYGKIAVNFYKGCTHGCEYCYLKKGFLAKEMGGDTPILKKGLTELNAMSIFESELIKNIEEIREHGLLFSFSTDPMLAETITLTSNAIGIATHQYGITCRTLTKAVDWVDGFLAIVNQTKHEDNQWRRLNQFGFTLTGRDDKEPNAPSNKSRILNASRLSANGFPVFFSIEPIINPIASYRMIEDTYEFADLYLIGTLSGGRGMLQKDARDFIADVSELLQVVKTPVYWKKSILDAAGYQENDTRLPEFSVDSNFKIL
jgi:DNA repair photolyase